MLMSEEPVYIESALCPVPIRDRGYVILGHGSGGKLSYDLISGLFLPPFDNPTLRAGDDAWLVRVVGQDADPGFIARLTVAVPGAEQRVPVDAVARVSRARATPRNLASTEGRPAVLLSVTKKSYTNTLELVDRIQGYIAQKNALLAPKGLALALTDDQTIPTRDAIGVMEWNAALGLSLVIAVCWVFLGTRVALLVALGIPFSLAGSFAVLAGAAAVDPTPGPSAWTFAVVLFLWTPPHFWSLALYRTADYARAGLPMLPVTHGKAYTRQQVLLYTLILFGVSLLPFAVRMSGLIYLAAACVLGGWYVVHALRVRFAYSDHVAQRAFRFSIVYLAALFAALLLDHYLLILPA